jgi:hypothetical protein
MLISPASLRGIAVAAKARTAMKRTPLWLIAVLLVGLAHWAEAQQSSTIPRIGYLCPDRPPPALAALKGRATRARLGRRENRQI